mgnify:FL=1
MKLHHLVASLLLGTVLVSVATAAGPFAARRQALRDARSNNTAASPESETDISAPQPPQFAAPQSPAELDVLRDRIDEVLTQYRHKLLNTNAHNPWEVMHAIIAYGCDTQLARRDVSDIVNAVSYMCWNGPCGGDRLLYINRGRIDAQKGPRVQGHYGQFLAILAQSKVKSDYPLLVNGQEFTLTDLIESEKLGCRQHMELTFKLIALAHYLDSDETWTNDIGEEWSIPRLLKAEIDAPIHTTACGGTHRLTAIYYPVYKRLKNDKPITGEYARAAKYTHDYHRYAFALQNPDGSFSTEWFKRRGDRPDVDRKLRTTGHILEWLAFTLPEDELTQPQTIRAAQFLTTILEREPNRTWEIGPLGHGLHALALYRSRVFDAPSPATTGDSVAEVEVDDNDEKTAREFAWWQENVAERPDSSHRRAFQEPAGPALGAP